MSDMLLQALLLGIAVFFAIIEGNGAVWFFNRIPPKWLTEYGETPAAELTDPYTQRIKSYPWKFLFPMLFILINCKLVLEDRQYALVSSIAIWLLLEIAIADIKYRIIPDELLLLLLACGIGLMPYQASWREALLGILCGAGVTGGIAFLGKITFRRESVGGGDIKFFAVLGFLLAANGVLLLFAAVALVSAGHMVYLLARRRIRKEDTLPMAPYISACAAAYLTFFWDKVPLFIF